jgi:hypothetical protein
MLQDMGSDFELLGELTAIEIIAVNLSVRERRRLRDQFGGRRWRQLKGVGRVRFPNRRSAWLRSTGMKRTVWAGGR